MAGVADMVSRLIAAGTPAELAASVVAEAFAAGASVRNSGGIPVDEAAERRRAYDRDRKRLAAEIRRKSAETPRISETPLTLTSSSNKDSDSQKEVKKVRARKASASPLSAEWQPNAAHFSAADRLKIPHSAVLEKAEDMRIWAKSNGATKVDWDSTFHGFLRRDASKLSSNGIQNGRNNVIDAADRLNEKLAAFERGDVYTELRGGTSPPDVRLLPPDRSR